MSDHRTAWWTSAHVDARGVPLCAVIRPVRRLMIDTDEMTEHKISEAFPDDWPPASWRLRVGWRRTEMRWNSYEGGTGWLVLKDGRIVAEELPQEAARLESQSIHLESDEAGARPAKDGTSPNGEVGFIYRTRGEPLSMWQLWRDYASIITEASERFDVPRHNIMACIAIEATRLPGDRLRFNPRAVREEPGYRSDEHTPNKISPGLMQTLLSTATDMLDRVPDLDDEDGPHLTREDLFVPRYSILLGTAYMRHQIARIEHDEKSFPPDDPILNLVAAYNAGSVRLTYGNRWHLVTYSDHRIDRFMAWNNDALEVLAKVDAEASCLD